MTRSKTACSGSPVSSPTWPRPPRGTRNVCWSTPAGRCAGPRPRLPSWPQAGVRDAAAGRRRGRLARAVNDLSDLLEATARIIGQTRQRIAGTTPDGATRVVSLHDRDARPIAKGRLGKPGRVRLQGRRSSTTTTASSWITTCRPETPPTHHNWRPRSNGSKPGPVAHPGTVTADRGYGEAAVEQALTDLGVRTVVIPRKGKTRPGPTTAGTTPSLPPNRQMANRMRGPDQHPQTRIRLGPHPPGQPRRSENLDRTRGLHPQPDQDRRPRPPETGHPDQNQPTISVSTVPPPTQPPTGRSGFFRSK